MLQEIQNVRIFVPRKHYEDFILNMNIIIFIHLKKIVFLNAKSILKTHVP